MTDRYANIDAANAVARQRVSAARLIRRGLHARHPEWTTQSPERRQSISSRARSSMTSWWNPACERTIRSLPSMSAPSGNSKPSTTSAKPWKISCSVNSPSTNSKRSGQASAKTLNFTSKEAGSRSRVTSLDEGKLALGEAARQIALLFPRSIAMQPWIGVAETPLRIAQDRNCAPERRRPR